MSMSTVGASRSARSRAAVVLIAMLALSACGLFLSEDAQLKRAQDAYKRGDLRAASIDIKSLLEKHPNNSEARFLLGEISLDIGDAASAARELVRARESGIANERVSEPLARAYLAQREFDKALQLADAQLGTIPQSDKQNARGELLRLRAEILFAKRQFADARAAFEASLAAKPDDVQTLLGLANVVESTDGALAAIAVTDRALKVAPNDPTIYAVRGALRLQFKQFDKAAAEFQKTVDLATAPAQKNELLAALAGLTQTQLALGKVDAALATTERMTQLAPNSGLTRFARAYALAQNGSLDKAQELLEQNLAKNDDLRSRLLLGAVNLNQGRYAQAEMHLAAVVAGAPNNTEARQLLAEARLRLSKPADALDTLLPAIEGGGNTSANMLALAAQASLAVGKTKEGVDLLKRNVQQHPENVRAQLDLAAGFLSTGQSDQALTVLNSTDKSADKVAKADSELEAARREYLNVVARLQKGDTTGAAAHATKVAQENPQNAALQSLAGSVLATERQFAKARPFTEAALKLRPDDASGYINLGRLDAMQGDLEAARKSFRTALDKQPGNSVAAMSLALLELSSQRSEAALAVLEDARKKNPKAIEPRILETQIYLSRQKLNEAEKLARETVALDTDNASALATLGRVLTLRGANSEALEHFERAVRAQPKSAALHYQLAVAQRVAGKVDESLQSTRDALNLDAHYLPAVHLNGLLSIAKGDLNTATRDADELSKSAPDQPGTHELLGLLRAGQNRFADAATEFHKATEIAPSAQYVIGEYQARVQAKESSPESVLEKYLDANPKDSAVRVVFAQVQQRRGDRAGAAHSYETVLTNDPKNAVALNNLAWMHFEDGKSDAVELAQRAYNVAPKSTEVADTYAWILVNTGKVNEGLKLFEALFGATDKNPAPKQTEVRAHYAVALARAGRQAEAKAIAKDITGKNAELSPDVHALLADLIKS